jgi:hypothetical protein
MLSVPQSNLNLLMVVTKMVINLIKSLLAEVSCYSQTLKIHNKNKEPQKYYYNNNCAQEDIWTEEG